MADINFSSSSPGADSRAPEGRSAAPGAADLRWDIIELLFFAYRDFVGDADHELEAFGFGRAHHRVLHFVHRYPGLKVADLRRWSASLQGCRPTGSTARSARSPRPARTPSASSCAP
jgi:hypothetical protein